MACDQGSPTTEPQFRSLSAVEKADLEANVRLYERARLEALYMVKQCVQELDRGRKGEACRSYSGLSTIFETQALEVRQLCQGLAPEQCPDLDRPDPIGESQYLVALEKAGR